MEKIFKMFLGKFFKVFGLTFVTAFCVIQLASITNENALIALSVIWLMLVITMAVSIGVVGVVNEEFYVTPTAILIIIGIIPFIKSYLATFGISVLWLGYELFMEDWFSDFLWHIEDCVKECKKAKEKRLSEEVKKQAFIEEYGEKNREVYDDVIKCVDEMIRFNEELYIDTDVWVKIKHFVSDKPESASKMRELLSRNVVLMLDVYHQLPKNEDGGISEYADDETLKRCKKVLYKLNKNTLKNFNEKKKMCNLGIDVCLEIVEKSLIDE